MIETQLRSHGYTIQTHERPSYRGCTMPPNRITQVVKEDFSGYALKVGDAAALEHFQRIKTVQDRIPHIAKIHEIIGQIVVTETALGTLLWELETAPHYVTSMRMSFDKTRSALES